METLYLKETEEDIKKGAEIIKTGGLVAFPTETVYGLGGNGLDSSASKKIYKAKGRPSDNPLILHIWDIKQIDDLAENFPAAAKKLVEEIWPGPLTIVLPKKKIVPDETTGGLGTVAIRMPANKASLMLIKESGVPIAAPSANISGRPSPTTWQHTKEDMDGKIDAIIMGDECYGGIESTIVDFTENTPTILRPGLITPERIEEIIGQKCTYDPAILDAPDETLKPKAPGMKYKHYAPKAEMILFSGCQENIEKVIKEQEALAKKQGKKVSCLIYKTDLDAAKNLFKDLRNADDCGADLILAAALPKTGSINFSVMNRMLKSAGYNIKEV